MTALLTHFGYWVQPDRQRAQGPAPRLRWRPLPQLLYAQVVKTICRLRLVRVTHRVVFGTFDRVNHVLAACGMGRADIGAGKGCLIYLYSPVSSRSSAAPAAPGSAPDL